MVLIIIKNINIISNDSYLKDIYFYNISVSVEDHDIAAIPVTAMTNDTLILITFQLCIYILYFIPK